MTASKSYADLLPDWYRLERETEKTIEKLSSVKELDYYLHNADEFIRRLAIIRLANLAAKESVQILSDLFENPLENAENKYLAGWAIKSSLVKNGQDIFPSCRHTLNFSGEEQYDELFRINIQDAAKNISLRLSSSHAYSLLKINEEDVVLERDIYFKAEFDFKQWSSKFLSSIPRLVLKTYYMLARTVQNAFKRIGKAKEKRIGAASGREEKKAAGYTDYYNLRRELYKRDIFFTKVKRGSFNLFYVLFFPLRFVLKHKLAVFCALLTAYLLVSFTEYGRAITYKYLGFEMDEVNSYVSRQARYYAAYASDKFNMLIGIKEWEEKKQTEAAVGMKSANVPADDIYTYYTVAAKKGLNIRAEPDKGSSRIGSEPLPYGSSVSYLEKKESDKSGTVWYYIKAEDGRIGWVSSSYLKKRAE